MIRGLQAIGHIAIRARDIDASLDFYCNRLGLVELHRLYRDNGELWLCYLRLSDSQIIELFPFGETDEAAPREATGLNHVCIEVEDLDLVCEDLEAAGIPLISPLKAGGRWQPQRLDRRSGRGPLRIDGDAPELPAIQGAEALEGGRGDDLTGGTGS